MADTTIPSFTISTEQNISLTIGSSNVQQQDQGYTYNQPGFSYNQIGVMYGGLYLENQDVTPLFTSAQLINPSISSIIDIGHGSIAPAGTSAILIGILGLTYP